MWPFYFYKSSAGVSDFLSPILSLPPWTCLHRFDLRIIIRWPENVRRVNKICLHGGHFIHCYVLLNFVLFFSSSWQCVTISNKTWK
jgi:hypothetical protein